MKFLILLLLAIQPSYAMYGYTVPNYEKLHVNQKCIMSCWAATAEAIYNYINPTDKKTQDDIVMSNPNVKDGNFCVPTLLSYNFGLGGSDYLLDTVLSNDQYMGNIIFRPGEDELDFIKKELHKNKPMITFYDFHARIIYGYFQLGDQTYLQLFNPASFFASYTEPFFNPWEILNYQEVINRKFIGTGNGAVSLVNMREK
jgi:hypothetical protein